MYNVLPPDNILHTTCTHKSYLTVFIQVIVHQHIKHLAMQPGIHVPTAGSIYVPTCVPRYIWRALRILRDGVTRVYTTLGSFLGSDSPS